MAEESESSFAFNYDGHGLTVVIGNLIPEQAIALLAGIRELLADTGAGEARARVARALDSSDTGVPEVRPRPEPNVFVSGGDSGGVEKKSRKGRRPRVQGLVNEPVQSDTSTAPGPVDSDRVKEHVQDTPEQASQVPSVNDPWGLVPAGEDPDSYQGADASNEKDGASAPDISGQSAADESSVDAGTPSVAWSREVIAGKGRLREMVEYLHSCGVDTPFKISSILNISSMRDDIAVISRIPEDQMEDRVKIIMESLGILK